MNRKYNDQTTGPESMERRRFLTAAGRYGLTAAAVASVTGTLWSNRALAQTAREEQALRASATQTMNVATPYILGASRSYPIMQLQFKENVQNFTGGKVYVKLAPGGQLGTANALVSKVQNGTIQAAQHSLSNFSPFAPVVDVVNIPYWCGENQQFVNLVTSDAWNKRVDPKIAQRGFKALWYVTIDPRTVGLRKSVAGPIKTPADMKGIKFRVPGSEILQKVYRLMGANPTPIAWGETTAAIKEGVADALDPAVNALFVFGFKDILSWITFNAAVQDAQVYSCNLDWFNGLPSKIKDGIEEASDVTFRQNLAKVPAARAYAMLQMRQAGVKFYQPTEAELGQWKEACGHQLDTWNDLKKELTGSLDEFNALLEASKKPSRYYVADV